jgi:hypothetical protein
VQDKENAVGNNYYLKSVDQLKPDLGVAKQVAAATYELSHAHGIDITYIFEFWNLAKVNTVPADATAFRRTPRLSSVVNIKYPHDTPEQLTIARACAEKLTRIVTALEGDNNINNGYANYSASPSFSSPPPFWPKVNSANRQ